MVFYALHDSDLELKKKGSFPVTKQKAKELNKQGFGIHWSVNKFKGRRKTDNLLSIRFWLCDIDEGSKSEQMALILALPIRPSVIVETKKGYHCYWKAKNATKDNYRVIQAGIIKKLNADPACKDVTRTLRCPGFYHMKDPNDPFLVEVVHFDDREFTEEQMLFAYKIKEKPKKVSNFEYKGNKTDFWEESNWERLFKISSINNGGRNNSLSSIRYWLKDEGFSKQEVYELISRINNKLLNPLQDLEIRTICRMRG